MKFFIDTAEVEHIREVESWGVLDGVTTNPTLVGKTGRDFEETIKEICTIVPGKPVSAEVVSTEFEAIMDEARHLATWADNIVVKVPFIKEGVKAIYALSQEGIRTNCTLVFTANQALIAAKAGASFISPFVGRLDDISTEGMDVVADIRTILDNYGFASEIIVASVRSPLHIIDAALMGADIATVPFDVLDKLFDHPLRDIGLERFLSDWHKYQDSLDK